ncbi:MAG: peptidylprolyl isomerase, partial [Pseudomonadota bacterium]|nr:peptidylprolyl isomerase [Pseudomonadota bacterium]
MRTRWYRDPLVAFLVLGALLFVIVGDLDEDAQSTIDVRSQDVARLAQQWAMQMQREPNARELQGLLDQYIKEEIYYREALRLGLDENDTIVRRRMVQKLTFLTEDLAVSDVPDQTVLKQFHLDNSDNYTEPKRYSFQHRYFSADRREDAEQIAERAITDTAIAGDPFMLQKQYAQRSQREIGDLFGREFAAGVANLQADEQWQGPLRSAYGWHVVRVTQVLPSRMLTFDEVQDRVLADWQQTQRKLANADYYRSLSDR